MDMLLRISSLTALLLSLSAGLLPQHLSNLEDLDGQRIRQQSL